MAEEAEITARDNNREHALVKTAAQDSQNACMRR
jgi:hypothetical protein